MKKRILFGILFLSIILSGCSANKENNNQQTEYVEDNQEIQDESEEKELENINTAENSEEKTNVQIESEPTAPSKEEVLAMRELVLDGMSDEEIERLTENIKVANQQMESAYFNDDIFAKLEDKESLYWNYFDQKGDIQISETETIYNRFHAENFINLLEEMKASVRNEELQNDLQQIIDQTALAAETHEMEYANNIYKLLHDMDYYLLRYGPEDVGQYTQDKSTVLKYYGVLKIYANS